METPSKETALKLLKHIPSLLIQLIAALLEIQTFFCQKVAATTIQKNFTSITFVYNW